MLTSVILHLIIKLSLLSICTISKLMSQFLSWLSCLSHIIQFVRTSPSAIPLSLSSCHGRLVAWMFSHFSGSRDGDHMFYHSRQAKCGWTGFSRICRFQERTQWLRTFWRPTFFYCPLCCWCILWWDLCFSFLLLGFSVLSASTWLPFLRRSSQDKDIGSLTNFLPFIVAEDQMAETLEKLTPFRTGAFMPFHACPSF